MPTARSGVAGVVAMLALATAALALLVLVNLAQHSPAAEQCRAAGGQWRTFGDTCDFEGSR
jgi:hypothetical protein